MTILKRLLQKNLLLGLNAEGIVGLCFFKIEDGVNVIVDVEQIQANRS